MQSEHRAGKRLEPTQRAEAVELAPLARLAARLARLAARLARLARLAARLARLAARLGRVFFVKTEQKC